MSHAPKTSWGGRCKPLDIQSSSGEYHARLRSRQQLPAWDYRDALLDAIEHNQITVVCGETGCGKSTQIPAFILEHDATLRASDPSRPPCQVVVTQPRRISAISLAERVAWEHCQTVGQSVGYRIRSDVRASDNTQLTYVTTGLLLRRITADPTLAGITHIVLDEVHEVRRSGS